MKMEETNTHLIEGCRRGNRTAQLALYKQFARQLYVACLRIVGNASEAEEAMQDSFLKIFTRLGQYQDGQCFEAWMHRIAIHTAIDYVRRQTPDWEELHRTRRRRAGRRGNPLFGRPGEGGLQETAGRLSRDPLTLPL